MAYSFCLIEIMHSMSAFYRQQLVIDQNLYRIRLQFLKNFACAMAREYEKSI